MQCVYTKKHLARVGVVFEEVVVDPSDPDDMNAAALQFMGFSSVPVVLVAGPGGESSWVGYSPDKIDALAVTG
jgi:glutaredoxin